MSDIIVIGIAGGSGSGKTTLTQRLADEFGDKITLVRHDDYYKAHNDLTYEQRSMLNYDHPDSFETELLLDHLSRLKRGESVDCPVYDYSIHNRSDETNRVVPAKVIVLEGILIFADRRLCDLIDIKIFVDTEADIRILRRVKRDVNKRGRSIESVMRQYIETVKPMHEKFVEPSKKNADIIVPEGGKNLIAVEMIVNQIRQYVDN